MPITIGSNIASLTAQRRLAEGTSQLSKTFERLSSGLRINRAADDAAGLAIAESLKADRRVFNQGIRNLSDGISVLSVADSALGELSGIVTRLIELAEQSANGTFGSLQRQAIDTEAQALSDEYLRITQSTEFNGRNLFSSSYGNLSLQAGYGVSGSITSSLGGSIGTGSLSAQTQISPGAYSEGSVGDFDGDGFADLVLASTTSFTVFSGGESGLTLDTQTGLASMRALASGDFNNDGTLDLAVQDGNSLRFYEGDGAGGFTNTVNTAYTGEIDTMVAGDFNGDGIMDLVAADYYSVPGVAFMNILLGSGDGSFSVAASVAVGSNLRELEVGDFDQNGTLDVAAAFFGTNELGISYGDGSGGLSALVYNTSGFDAYNMAQGDFNNDGLVDLITTNPNDSSLSIYFGDSSGSFGVSTSIYFDAAATGVVVKDFNGDGNDDIAALDNDQTRVRIYLGNGDGTFNLTSSVASGSGEYLYAGDFNGDGVADVVTNNILSTNQMLSQTTSGLGALSDFSVLTMADAREALPMLQRALGRLSSQRGQIGAFQARIEVGINNLQSASENYAAAESRIRDADIAAESANLVRLNILQQAASAVLGQANLQPQLALRLLSGGQQ